MSLRLILVLAAAARLRAQSGLPVKWEELTAGDFAAAVGRSGGVCLLPFGIVEKHGPHLPLGSDLIQVRSAAVRGATDEYAVVFPEYYFGQIFEAMHQPGTIAYSARLQLELLQETTAEMARNGCKKIIIVNGHGGNNSLLPFFAQTQLASLRDYVVYVTALPALPAGETRKPQDGHAGDNETSDVMAIRPDLVHLDRAGSQSGVDRKRQDLPPGINTGIGWYARFPEHYAGDGSTATRERGEVLMQAWSRSVAAAIRAVKADQVSLRLQNEFFERQRHPLDTPQR